MIGLRVIENKVDIKRSPSGVRLTGNLYSQSQSQVCLGVPGMNNAGDFLLYAVVGICKSQQHCVCSSILWDSVNSNCDTKEKADRQWTC